jgi:tRNA(Ile)-lysidine synthase
VTTFVAAVSGGVDSVALLHMLAQTEGHEVIVAHFDHGIRDDSHEDAAFVRRLAEHYGLPFETSREELGAGASEEKARDRRYAYLRTLAEKHGGRIVTAHHGDDAIESIAINVHRGTGWRGLAVLDSDVLRPLLHLSKAQLTAYADKHGLAWREDSTNASDAYLRNRVRKTAAHLPEDEKRELLRLRSAQIEYKNRIERMVVGLIGEGPQYSRYFFTHIPNVVALECLRYATSGKLTRPQLERLLLAIKTAAPKSRYTAGAGIAADFTTRNFSFSLLK